ncbi:peptidase [Fusarium beomiforme]|uniref:Peptidase n=1 Tax=Fusarium beomiforme TaxID=44412 RepID=A0A9P5AGF1_9HYPO|nr:peptidase [Fusarium beomiforme]
MPTDSEYGLEVEEGVSFGISLAPKGEEGSGFHTQNDPSNPYQRENVIERKGAVDIRCSSVDIIHGLFDPEGDDLCTLLVLEFRFDPRKRARRIAHVDIELRFAGSEPGVADPHVYDIAPKGNMRFAQTTQTETTTTGGEVTLGAGAFGASVGTGLSYEREIAREMSYAASVTGSIDLREKNYGKPNCASWTLMENPELKTGVPVSMRTAILLKRRDEGRFQCVVSIRAKADWRTSLEWLVGTTRRDDPVLLDPTLGPTSDRYEGMEMSLGKLDLNSICDITSANIVENVVKMRKIGDQKLA